MNILFVCTGNTCRSPMAAGLMNKIAVERDLDVRIESAGIMTVEGLRASGNAVRAMTSYGVDISEHRSKSVTEELLEASDLILAMTEAHKIALMPVCSGRVFTVMEYAGMEGGISDPYGGDLQVYEECAREIYDALLVIADKIEGNQSHD